MRGMEVGDGTREGGGGLTVERGGGGWLRWQGGGRRRGDPCKLESKGSRMRSSESGGAGGQQKKMDKNVHSADI